MRMQHLHAAVITALLVVSAIVPAHAQSNGKYLAPHDEVVAIRAGKLFDAKSGNLLDNQVIVIRGDRIAEVGAGLSIPDDATVIDLSAATVLPGMVGGAVHG